MHDNDPTTIEKEMSQLKHFPGWNEVLASVSEAYLKADQHKGHINVEETIEEIKKKHNGYNKVTQTNEVEKGTRHQAEPDDNTIDRSERELLQGPLGRTRPPQP